MNLNGNHLRVLRSVENTSSTDLEVADELMLCGLVFKQYGPTGSVTFRLTDYGQRILSGS